MRAIQNHTIPDLVEACHKPGCPICRLEQGAVERYLKDLFETRYHETDIRTLLRVVKGFCKEHSWLANELGLGSTFGAVIIYHDLLWTALDDIKKFNSSLSSKRSFSTVERILLRLGFRRVTATSSDVPSRCPACIEQGAAAHAALGVLASGLKDDTFLVAFRESTGLCLPHLHQALALPPDAETVQALVSISNEKLETLRKQVTAFIRENEYKTPEQIRDIEKNFWPQVVGVISGYDLMSKKKG